MGQLILFPQNWREKLSARQAQRKIWLINLFIYMFIDGSADSVARDVQHKIWLINFFIYVSIDGSVDFVSPEVEREAIGTSGSA